ncbi:L-rhamnose-binding lectin ELEL-1 isoform X1 [Hydra vulgaris]|uniref:L-rhamnose-binding lectin ELEL-1 isoform X1 n=1 Tax=Hydra vulgaris TaxID=6087 RepID=UPI000192762B|nr:L-rhamnose-binding lectin ELEL-1 [Hydra vulgaris]
MILTYGVYFLFAMVLLAVDVYSSSSACMADQCKYMTCPPGYKCAVNIGCGCTVSCKLSEPNIARACEHYSLSIDCKGDGYIEVVSANYGRTVSTLCPGGNSQNVNCTNEFNSINVIASKCDGMPSCNILAENSIFTDPCVGTYKYLEVKYYCSW